MTNSQNPLIELSTLKHQAVPFDAIQPEHFLPALEYAIQEGKEKIEGLKAQTAAPDFENSIVALENSNDKVDYVAKIFYNLLSAHTNDQLQSLANEMGPRLSEFSSDVMLDGKLFARVKDVYAKMNSLNLTQEQKRLLEITYDEFVRNGANLSEADKETLRKIDQELSVLSPKFSENVLKATNEFEVLIENKEDLSGLPDSALQAAEQAAREKGKTGWLFTLHFPSYEPVLKYADNRELRKKLWTAMMTRAFGGPYDNQANIKRIVELRHQRAVLLGYKTHADYVLRKRMAETPERVEDFLRQLLKNYKPAAIKDVEAVKKLAKESGLSGDFQPWDFTYYAEKLKQKTLQFHEEELRPYFPLERVIEGAFEHARRLYGLKFKQSQEYPVYHPDVKAYEVYQESDDAFVGLFYCDFFPRASKRSGAWMTNYFEQGFSFGKNRRPHVSIVCNFTKPLPDKPSLLTYNEVRTLFHEFGHSLHSLLSQCQYRSLAGTNVYWDFVELPSQIFENWISEKSGLDLFARHYQTNELIPDDLAEKIRMSEQFLAGYTGLRQINFGMLDMAWHNQPPKSDLSVSDFEQEATRETTVLPKIPGTNVSCSFSHIFAGGYSAGYYSYKWAEVLDADAFEMFKENGLFDRKTATSFRDNILSRGGSQHPMELYKKFRGREPDPKALLRREGLL